MTSLLPRLLGWRQVVLERLRAQDRNWIVLANDVEIPLLADLVPRLADKSALIVVGNGSIPTWKACLERLDDRTRLIWAAGEHEYVEFGKLAVPVPERFDLAVISAWDLKARDPDGRFERMLTQQGLRVLCIKTSRRVGIDEDPALTAIFGDVRARIPCAYAMLADVTVTWVPLPPSGSNLVQPADLSPEHDAARNRRVAHAALEMAPERRPRSPNLAPARSSSKSTLVLAADMRQASQLKEFLPGWRIVEDQSAIESWRSPTGFGNPLDRTIFVPPMHWSKPIEVDVLINATGGPAPLKLQRFPPLDKRGTRVVEVVDFADEGEPYAERTRLRHAGYERRGWRVAEKPDWL